MLELRQITKEYGKDENVVSALKGVSIKFRKNEFVSILGPSGCGKTTMLNIIGGLDRYTKGDLLINGKSTVLFSARDWDTYRNRSVGFVFQSYNLIPHQTVLGNVELALTLSGISKTERRRRAAEALSKVGLSDQLHKRPNQMSGGQMQRVAIARAIVNDPEIILADEPTGALDSVTSVQVLELLKEIAKDRLVIMVTHNNELADQYSTRIIRLLDGEILGDTNPVKPDEATQPALTSAAPYKNDSVHIEKPETTIGNGQTSESNSRKGAKKRASMSFFTALNLSLKNLLTKKRRTFITSFAGSIGIIGIALVLAISNGFSLYIDKMQSDTLSNYPLAIPQVAYDIEALSGSTRDRYPAFPDSDELIVYDRNQIIPMHFNMITQEYLDYLNDMPGVSELVNEIKYSYSVPLNVLTQDYLGEYIKADTNKSSTFVGGQSSRFQEAIGDEEFMVSQYDVLGGEDAYYPTNSGEIALVVDSRNRINAGTLKAIGLEQPSDVEKVKFADLIGKEYKLVYNNGFYQKNEATGFYNEIGSSKYAEAYADEQNTKTLKITCILRVKESAPLNLFSSGLLYLQSLMDEFMQNSVQSDLAKDQLAEDEKLLFPVSVSGVTISTFAQLNALAFSGKLTDAEVKEYCLKLAGASNVPSAVYIYPKNFESQKEIISYLDAWNDTRDIKIMYQDASQMFNMLRQLVGIIQYVLIAFAGVSLVVSSIMIGIITYTSVIERTKEIGVLRSIGARKIDISSVFNAETILIGVASGLIGILLSYILCIPINIIIGALAGAELSGSIAVLNPLHSFVLIFVSMGLTLIGGLIPSIIAANKDPVSALRSE